MTINRGVWTEEEHDRFLQAIQVYPHGPWRYVAKHVGTRDVRQVQTHAQKYYEKVERHMRGLRKERRSWVRSEHRIDDLPPGLQRNFKSNSPPPHAEATNREDVAGSSTVLANDNLRPGSLERLEPVPFDDSCALPADSELPSLEESLEFLLQCLSDY